MIPFKQHRRIPQHSLTHSPRSHIIATTTPSATMIASLRRRHVLAASVAALVLIVSPVAAFQAPRYVIPERDPRRTPHHLGSEGGAPLSRACFACASHCPLTFSSVRHAPISIQSQLTVSPGSAHALLRPQPKRQQFSVALKAASSHGGAAPAARSKRQIVKKVRQL